MLLSSASEAINAAVPAERRLDGESPVIMLKVIKNEVEAQGMKNAHIRDGVAVIKYLHWLENAVGKENVTEISGAEVLTRFRRFVPDIYQLLLFFMSYLKYHFIGLMWTS